MYQISRCLLRYPRIAELVTNPYVLYGNLSVSLRRPKGYAVELARAIAMERLQQGRKLQRSKTIGKQRGNAKGAIVVSTVWRRGQRRQLALFSIGVAASPLTIKASFLYQPCLFCKFTMSVS